MPYDGSSRNPTAVDLLSKPIMLWSQDFNGAASRFQLLVCIPGGCYRGILWEHAAKPARLANQLAGWRSI